MLIKLQNKIKMPICSTCKYVCVTYYICNKLLIFWDSLETKLKNNLHFCAFCVLLSQHYLIIKVVEKAYVCRISV